MFRNHITNRLSAYLDGELPAEEARRVSEHLVGCRGCRAAYDEIRFGARMVARIELRPAPDAVWRGIEAALDGPPVAVEPRSGSIFSIPAFKFAAALAAVIAISGLLLTWQRDETVQLPSWEVTRIAGAPSVGDSKIERTGRLALGQWLTTDAASRAQISVGQIGEVKIEPNSRVQLVEARESEHRLSLAVGRLEAFIWAPPRQFFVDTPSAVAVDLGCSYTLEVDRKGAGLLHVTLGWVAFEWKGRESFVPAGAMCSTRPEFGPGTPYFDDAPAELVGSLAEFDTAGAPESRTRALEKVLFSARKRDGLTLWHLLSRTAGDDRGQVYDRLAGLIPPPDPVTRAGVLAGDRKMIDAWWEELELGDSSWWRMWKGPVPAQ